MFPVNANPGRFNNKPSHVNPVTAAAAASIPQELLEFY